MSRFLLTILAAAGCSGAAACEVRTGAVAPVVVELYTSEGCSSCPPADRWLSGLKGRPDVVALAFHVDYWDRLGWVDRFADPAFTERQYRKQPSSGARFVYTPQVLANGKDWRQWPRALPPSQGSRVDIVLRRASPGVTADVSPRPGAPARLAGYWAVVEHGHVSQVKAGENTGATLQHDHVVRRLRPVPPWSGPARLELDLDTKAGVGEVLLVVEDADTGRPVQAVRLAC
jgi:hypothetical protein